MGGHPRIVTVKRGVRYNWRDSLESILEEGELSKFTVHPSGVMNLYITRPKKNKPRSHKNSAKKRKKKKRKKNLCTISSWIHSAKNILSTLTNIRSLTNRDQCVQTDCAIPVSFNLKETEEICPCHLRSSSPATPTWLVKERTFLEPYQPHLNNTWKPTFGNPRLPQRDIAVPKTKPRTRRRFMQPNQTTERRSSHEEKLLRPSETQTYPLELNGWRIHFVRSFSPLRNQLVSKNEAPFAANINGSTRSNIPQPGNRISQRVSTPSQKKTLFPCECLHLKDSNFSFPKAQERLPRLFLRGATGDYDSHNIKRPINAKSSKSTPKRAKTIGGIRTSLKPTMGVARFPALYTTPYICKPTNSNLALDQMRLESSIEWEPSNGDSWGSQQLDETRLEALSRYQTSGTPKNQTCLNTSDLMQRNSRETLRKEYSSHCYFEPASKNMLMDLDYDINDIKLRRKKGSYTLPNILAPLTTKIKCYGDTRKLRYYYPSKFIGWPSHCGNNGNWDNGNQDINAKRDFRTADIRSDSSTTIIAGHLSPKRLRKVYSYYEITSQPILYGMTSKVNQTSGNKALTSSKVFPVVKPYFTENQTSANKTATPTKVYPAVEPNSTEKSADGINEFLLRLKNLLSRYFSGNCNGRRNLEKESQELRGLRGKMIRNEENMKSQKEKVQQEDQLKLARKESTKLGFRHCY